MKAKKQLQDIPYDGVMMSTFAINADLPVLSTYEERRELCDLTMQRYLDVQPEEDQQAIDNVEDSIHYLMKHPEIAIREYDTGLDVLQRMALVRQIGAQALREEIHPILTRPLLGGSTQGNVEQSVDSNESAVAAMLDDTIIDLVTAGEIDAITAQGLLLLFQLRESPNPYSLQQRQSLSIITQRFYATARLATKQQPIVVRKNSRELKDPGLQEGMELINTLNELLKLPDTRTQHPLSVYLDSRSRASAKTGEKAQLRAATLNRALTLICAIFEPEHPAAS